METLESESCEKIVESITDKMPQNLLICPFCCEEYLFEFTIKNHLRKEHSEEIKKLDNWPINQHFCPYCNAMFYYKALLPRHIVFAHSKKTLDEWFSIDDNLQKFQIDRENQQEPSFKLLDCSPGLSTIFNELDTCDSIKKFKRNDSTFTATPRSILKKTPHSGKIVILSPETVALRRTLNNLKRSASARRELRFDLPPLQTSPEMTKCDSLPSMNFESPQKRNSFWSFLSKGRRSKSPPPPPINGRIKRRIREKACKLSNKSANHIITSTPMSFSYYDSDVDAGEEHENSIGGNWRSATKSNDFKPLFFSAERFQCNLCREKFDSNYELLNHQKEKHKWISLRPSFRCGSCGTKFFRNSLLVRHCHHQHTPLKHRH
jgi:hypothetical protein